MTVFSKQGYKGAFKSTSLFGGVQIFTILIGIIRSKFIAIWLGPSGFGLMSLFNSVITLIFSISNLGLASSAVRDISKANQIDDGGIQLSKTIKSINKCVILTGLIGCFLTISFSSLLSWFTFGSSCYTNSFIVLSVVIFINGIYGAHYAVLQGVRRLPLMAKARIIGSFIGTSVTLPLFCFYREKAIVPSLVITSFVTYIISSFYVRKIKLVVVKQSIIESLKIGKSTIKLGIMMALTVISVSVVEFFVKTFITKLGGISEVGLYQAGWTLNAQYLGLVFTAMATDYFPKLSSISHDNNLVKKSMNEQAEIAILILGPMIAIMMVAMPIIILYLYSSDFLKIVPMARWLMFGSLIKAGSWAVSFVFLAKGDGKIFLFNELGINSITLPSYLLGYYLFGINGIGYAFTFNYVIYFIWVIFVANKKYGLSYSVVFQKLLLVQLLLSALLIFIVDSISGTWMYILSALIILIVMIYSFVKLDDRLDLLVYIKKKIIKK